MGLHEVEFLAALIPKDICGACTPRGYRPISMLCRGSVPGPARGGAGQFFASLAGVEFHTFEPRLLLEGGDTVAALIDVSFTVKETGVLVSEEDEIHIWTFDTDGKVSVNREPRGGRRA